MVLIPALNRRLPYVLGLSFFVVSTPVALLLWHQGAIRINFVSVAGWAMAMWCLLLCGLVATLRDAFIEVEKLDFEEWRTNDHELGDDAEQIGVKTWLLSSGEQFPK